MKNKITKKLLVAMLIAVGYTNLQAQGIGVVDHKGTKNTLNNVTSGTNPPATTPTTTKGDIYRRINGGKTVASFVFNGSAWEKLNRPAEAEVTGTKGSVFFANTDGTPTEDNTNFFWDNSNKNLKISKTVIGDRWIGIGEKLTTTTDTYLDFYSNGSTGQQSRIARYRGANGDLSFENKGTGSVRFYHNGGNRLLIRSNGNVGIGTDTPDEKLDVNGKAKIRTIDNLPSIGTNKVVVVGIDGILKKATLPASSSPFQAGDFKWSNKTADHGNWKLCDGTDGTPDLRGRFLRMLPKFNTAPGAWNYQLAQKYSSDNRTITIKKENIPDYTLPTAYTSYAGKHKHKEWAPGDFKKNAGTNSGATSYASGSFQTETTEAGEHRHTVSVKSGGSGTGIKLDVIPGHYTLNIFMYKP